MDEETLDKFEKQYRDLPDARVQAEIERWLPDSAPRRILLGILAERRSAAKESERRRFEQTYEQMERHHRDSKRVSLIAAAISVLAAFAAWASVWYSGVQTRIALDTFRVEHAPSPSIEPASQPASAPTVVPSATPEATSPTTPSSSPR